LLVDRRGFGASPADGRVDFERDAEDVAELLADGAHLVGHSYGGVVSLLAAARRPDAVRSLVLIEPPAFGVARGRRGGRGADPATSTARARQRRIRASTAQRFCTRSASLRERTALAGDKSHCRPCVDDRTAALGGRDPARDLARAGLRVLLVQGDWCPRRLRRVPAPARRSMPCATSSTTGSAQSVRCSRQHTILRSSAMCSMTGCARSGNRVTDVRDAVRLDRRPLGTKRSASSGRSIRSPEDERDLPGLIRRLTEDCVYELIQTGHRWEDTGVRPASIWDLLSAFPDIHFDLDRHRHRAAGRLRRSGRHRTHEADWLGFPPSGERLSWKVGIFFPWDPELAALRGERVYTAGLPLGDLR
jgi:hypothetical protein